MKLIIIAAIVFICGCAAEEQQAPAASNAPPTPAKADIPSLKSSYEHAKQAGDKAQVVDATVKYATAVMLGPGKPNEKYPTALKLYEEALKLDPQNQEALANRQMILDIYKSLNREPPK